MKSIDRTFIAAAAALTAAVLAGSVTAAQAIEGPPPTEPATSSSTLQATNPQASTYQQRDPQSVIASWPQKTKSAAQALIEKYGPPDAVSDKMVSWNDKDQWSMVGVFRDAVSSSEPTTHQDFIVNKINYAVPENKVGDLAHFDHSLVVDQARGTLAAQGDSEQHNILALNLANEIVTGKRSVASARSFQKKTLSESMAGRSSSYNESLMFKTSPSSEILPAGTPPSEASPSGTPQDETAPGTQHEMRP
jgi:hypothetical protein